MHPLLRIIGADPQLLLEHAEAYAALVAADFGSAVRTWMLRVVWLAAALLCLFVSAILLGVAVMLWASSPVQSPQTAAVLATVTLLPACAAALCAFVARAKKASPHADNLQRQVQADLQMLREVSP